MRGDYDLNEVGAEEETPLSSSEDKTNETKNITSVNLDKDQPTETYNPYKK